MDITETDIWDAFRSLLGVDEFVRLRVRFGTLAAGYERTFGLSLPESFGVWIYTTPMHWHEAINRALWSNDPSIEILIIAAVINRAIERLPRFVGPVFRGLRVPDLTAFAAPYVPGDVITWPGLTSCAREMDSAFGGNVLFVIASKNGRSLRYVSAGDGEDEVLMAAGTRYIVNGSELSPGRLLIDLEEWAP